MISSAVLLKVSHGAWIFQKWVFVSSSYQILTQNIYCSGNDITICSKRVQQSLFLIISSQLQPYEPVTSSHGFRIDQVSVECSPQTNPNHWRLTFTLHPSQQLSLIMMHLKLAWVHFGPQRLQSFWSAPRIANSGKVQFFEHEQSNRCVFSANQICQTWLWACAVTASSGGPSRRSQFLLRPKGARTLGTRMTRTKPLFAWARKGLGMSLALQCFAGFVSSSFPCKISWAKRWQHETKVNYSFFSFLYLLYPYSARLCAPCASRIEKNQAIFPESDFGSMPVLFFKSKLEINKSWTILRFLFSANIVRSRLMAKSRSLPDYFAREIRDDYRSFPAI